MTTRRSVLGAALALVLTAGCGDSGTCVFFGGGATPTCSEFQPGEVVATVRARPGETASSLRDRVFTELASIGVDTSKLVGLLGWAQSQRDLNSDDVQIGGQQGDQLTTEDDPVYPENYEFVGGETIVFFVLDFAGVVDVSSESTVEEAADEVPAEGDSIVIRNGRITGIRSDFHVLPGDRVVVYAA